MKMSETYFAGGKPVGRIVRDSQSGAVAFIPRDGKSALADRHWRTVDELRAALRAVFGPERAAP